MSQATGQLFQRHPEVSDAYLLRWNGETLPVTFSAKCFDAHPETVRFLSYGSPLLAELLQNIPAPDNDPNGDVIRLQSNGDLELRGWYAGDAPLAVETLSNLRAITRTPTGVASDSTRARGLFAAETQRLRDAQQAIIQHRRTATHLAERVKAQRVLSKVALVEIALGQQRSLFDADVYPASFSEQAVTGLQRHGAPWRALLQLAFERGVCPKEDDPYYAQIKNENRDSLKARFGQLKNEARQAVERLNTARTTMHEEMIVQETVKAEVYKR